MLFIEILNNNFKKFKKKRVCKSIKIGYYIKLLVWILVKRYEME